jgi:beta-phosphoglucomutase
MRFSPSLRAVIFDFNGVIADDEHLHFAAFQQALAEAGLSLSKEDYYGRYQGMDERNCLAALRTIAAEFDAARMARILERKALLFRDAAARQRPQLFRGVEEVVKRVGERYRLAIASGGRREQIDRALKDTTIERDFTVIVSAEDTAVGKPDPAIYRMALKLLNGATPCPRPPLRPDECLVIEDSVAGIRAALAAGMRVIAVATTYPAQELAAADLVVPDVSRITLGRMAGLFGEQDEG